MKSHKFRSNFKIQIENFGHEIHKNKSIEIIMGHVLIKNFASQHLKNWNDKLNWNGYSDQKKKLEISTTTNKSNIKLVIIFF